MNTDQKRALGLGIGGAGVIIAYLKYKKDSGSSSTPAAGKATSNATPSLTNGATGSVTPYTPQSPVTLQPGESVYNPNTGALYSAPDDTTTPDTATPQATSAASPAYVVNVNYPATVAKAAVTKKPATRKVTKPKAKAKAK